MNRFILVIAATLLLACGPDRATTIASLTGNAASGKTFYEQQCVVCHGADGKSGSAGHNIVAHAQNEATEAVTQLLKGNSEGMPSYSSQTDQTLADVVAYVRSLN